MKNGPLISPLTRTRDRRTILEISFARKLLSLNKSKISHDLQMSEWSTAGKKCQSGRERMSENKLQVEETDENIRKGEKSRDDEERRVVSLTR